MGKPKAPAPPDPKQTAAAQTGTNVSTAIANTAMGNVNQVGPDGSLTYSESGMKTITDPNTGLTYQVPTYTATTSLSDQNQAIYDQNKLAELGLAETAANQAGFLRDYLGEPADLDTSAIEGRLYDLGSQRLDPRFAREEDAMRTRLAQQGITPGSAAYNSEMERLSQSKNDAYNQLLLQGRGQAFSELVNQRNQPINEITALLSGSQVSAPNYAVNNPAQMPTVDYAGLVNQNYNQRLNAWQQQNANRQSLMGGLFGLGAAGIGAL